jgi:hypothetical protein
MARLGRDLKLLRIILVARRDIMGDNQVADELGI